MRKKRGEREANQLEAAQQKQKLGELKLKLTEQGFDASALFKEVGLEEVASEESNQPTSHEVHFKESDR